MSEQTASGLIVERDPKPIPTIRGFGSLKGDVLARMPRLSREPELTASEIQARCVEVQQLLEQMRATAYRDRDTAKLNDVHILTFELQLTMGEAKTAKAADTNRLHLPGR